MTVYLLEWTTEGLRVTVGIFGTYEAAAAQRTNPSGQYWITDHKLQ